MMQDINLEEVKKYNANLKQYRDRAAQLKAEIDFNNKEIDAACAELSNELGVSVTRDNLEQIYAEQVSKINSTLQSGNAVLAKIASEENQTAQQAQVSQATPVAQAPQAQAQAQVVPPQQATPVQPQAPVFQQSVQPQTQPAVNVTPQQMEAFAQQANTQAVDNTFIGQPLPQMF